MIYNQYDIVKSLISEKTYFIDRKIDDVYIISLLTDLHLQYTGKLQISYLDFHGFLITDIFNIKGKTCNTDGLLMDCPTRVS